MNGHQQRTDLVYIANVAKGSVFNNENLKKNFSFEASKARKVIYNLLRDMPTEKVYQDSNWNTLTFYYRGAILWNTALLAITKHVVKNEKESQI